MQVYAALLPTDQGGSIRLSAPGSGDSGVEARLLESLGFAVQTGDGVIRAIDDAHEPGLEVDEKQGRVFGFQGSHAQGFLSKRST